jgi:hypothetical protein
MSNLGFFTVYAILKDCIYRKKTLIWHEKLRQVFRYKCIVLEIYTLN